MILSHLNKKIANSSKSSRPTTQSTVYFKD
jgi:hypothetical protein